MKKTMKKIPYIAAFACAASALLFTGVALNNQVASAEEITTNFQFVEGASIRVDTESNTSGIRFVAKINESFYGELVNAEKTALKEGAEVGMIIVPDFYYEGYKAQTEIDDYFTYFEEVKGKTKAQVSVSFPFEKIIQSGSNYQMQGAIVGIKEGNLNLDYRAIAYYKETATAAYKYQVHTDARSITYVADKALADTEVTYADAQKDVMAGFINTAFSKGISVDITETKALGLSDTAATYTGFDSAVVTVENGVVIPVSVGTTNITVSAYDGKITATVPVTVTDNQPADFTFTAADKSYAEKIYIDKATLNAAQNVTFTYAVTDKQGNPVPLTAEGDSQYIVPGAETEFIVTATAMRGENKVGEKSYTMHVYDDVYAWLVNSDNDASALNVSLNADAKAEYTTQQALEGLHGSFHVSNDDATNGAITLSMKGVGNLASNQLSFYLYNPTGVALSAYFYTNNGYWVNQAGGVISNQASIPEAADWHKVDLTITATDFGTMLGNGSAIELRITTSDWSYAGEKYHVYMSNISYNVSHGAEGVEYNANGFVATGSINTNFNLPYGQTTDARYSFSYELKKGEETVAIDGENAFTPTVAGDYTYVIGTMFRGEVVDAETYEFTISDEPLVLSTAAYYQFDANGMITLPAATIAADTTGKTVEYSVTNPANVTTVLGEDRTYDTGKVHGDYTYTVAIKNGETVESSKSATIKMQSSKVLFACGNSSEGVTYDNLNSNNSTLVSYTTEEAAPGEIGSMKLSQAAWVYIQGTNTPRLELVIRLISYARTDATKLRFWIKHEDLTNKIMVNSYSTNGSWWISQRIHSTMGEWDANITTNATTYNEWAPHIVGGGWYQVEIDITNNPGTDFSLWINSDQQTFDPDKPIYISNIYYE